MKRASTTKTSSDKFQPGDRVFAKVKGWPPWPAKVLNRMDGKGESYNVIFCGTYDTRVLKLDSLFAYDKANRAEYGKPKNRNRWKEGMEEIDKNIPISEKGRVGDEKQSAKEKEVKTTARKGTKVEDEKPPIQEPVKTTTRRAAKAEEEKPPAPEPVKTPGRKAAAKAEEEKPPEKEPAKTPGRKAAAKAEEEKPPAKEPPKTVGRKSAPAPKVDEEEPPAKDPPKTVGRKSAPAAKVDEEEPPAKEASQGAKTPARKAAKPIASKRDSISSGPSETESNTPAASTTPSTSAADSVRRSGRQAKPKRFADDIIATPISRKSTGTPSTSTPKTAETETEEIAAATSTPTSEETSTASSPPVKKRKVDKTPKKAVEKSTKESEDTSEMDTSEMDTQVIPTSPQKSAAAPSATAISTTPELEPLSSPPIKKRKAGLKTAVKSTPPPPPTVKESEPVKPDSPSKKIAASISYEGNVVAIKSPAVIPAASSPPKLAVLSLSSPSTPSILKKRKAEKSPSKAPPPVTVEKKEGENVLKKLASSSPTKESVKPAEPSAKKTPLSLEAMMAAVSSIKAPVISTSPVKPAVASPASTLASTATPESSSSPAASATAIKKRKVEKTYSRTPTTPADKGIKEGADTTKNPSPFPKEFIGKASESSAKKVSVSFEAMMAAVSSIKTPFTPKLKNKSGTASEQQKIKHNIESGTVQQPMLISAASAMASAGQQPMSVEILRQKTKSGGTTVVVVQQQQKGEDGEDIEAVGGDGDDSDADSYDEYMYFDREFEFEHEEDIKTDREFERFHVSLKKFLQLPGRWTMGGVQWDPQGKRKVILISEPEIPPNGRPIVKRCLQFFEDKSIRVFIDQMDMTDVFGMTCYAEKEDVASLVVRVADASSCCGVPEMVVDDLVYFPDVRKRNTSYFAPNCPGVIANDEYDPICTACKEMQIQVKECRRDEKLRLQERRIRSEDKMFEHPFGKALYNMFDDLVDETDPSKPKKKRTKETFFRKFLHDTRLKVNGDSARTERVYIEKPISVDSVSQSFQDIVSKLGFNVPNAKKRPSGGLLPRPSAPTQTTTSTPRSSAVSRIFPGSTSNLLKMHQERKQSLEHISMPFTPGSSFTLDDGQEYELIGEVEPGQHEFVEMKATPNANQQPQFEIIEVDDETLARLKNQVVVLPESTTAGGSIVTSSSFPITTRIDANDPNLSQILKAINTSHGFKVS